MQSACENPPSNKIGKNSQTVNNNQHIDLPQILFLVPSKSSSSQILLKPEFRENDLKLNFKDKLRALRKKKEVVHGIIKKTEKGPHRISRKYLKHKRNNYNLQYQSGSNQQVQSDYQTQYYNSSQHFQSTMVANLQYPTQQKCRIINRRQIMQQSFTTMQSLIKKQMTLNDALKQGKKVEFKLLRNNQGWNFFKPQFTLVTSSGKELAYSKKTTPTTFILSRNNRKFQQNSSEYLGKIVSNISGSLLNLYMRTLNLITDKQEDNLICSIQYANSYLQLTQPRFIRVYFDRHYGKKFHHSGKTYSSVKQMYEAEGNHSNISIFQSRKPVYCKETKSYNLDFQGRAQISSIKNFILEDINHRGRDYLLFGKSKTNQYNLDAMHPFTPLIAFSICLSSFNGKIICE